MIETAYIGLGGNLGDPFRATAQAIDVLRQSAGIFQVRPSACYRTVPVESSGPDFCNAVAEIKTDLPASQVLALLLSIEQRFGRQRSVRNAPRTLDLDLIAYGSLRCTDPNMTIPHPRAHERAFVLIPLCELNPDVLLGPADQPKLLPASKWKAQLSESQQNEVRPW